MDAALVSVLAYGGLRPREALALRWSDLSDTQFVVRGNSGRFGLPVQDRSVSMLRALDRDLEVLRTDRQVDRDGYVFGDDACHVHNDWLRDWRRDAYGSAAARCFPRPCAPGMLRFVLATLLLREGKSIAAVADQLGESADFLAELYERDDLPCTDQKPGLADAEIATAREAAAPALWSSAMVERFADDGKVIAGKDGWLFLAYDGNRVLDQHLGRLRLSDVQLERWTSALEMRVSWLEQRGIRSLFLIAPNTHSIYPEQLPDGLPMTEKRPVQQLVEHLRACRSPAQILYPLEQLDKAKAERPVCFTVDSHWNDWGAYVAYLVLVEGLHALGISCRKLEEERLAFQEIPILGGLGAKAGIGPRPQYFAEITPDARLVHDNRVINRGEQLVLECDAVPPTACLLFGDSYARSLVRYLGETFARLTYGWTPLLDRELVERERPDVVINVLTERFLIRVPDPTKDPSLAEWEARKQARNQLRPRLRVWDR